MELVAIAENRQQALDIGVLRAVCLLNYPSTAINKQNPPARVKKLAFWLI